MIRVNGPLMSLSASGQVGKKLIFSKRKSGQMIRAFHKPNKERTPAQIIRRKIISLINIRWSVLTDEQKAVYNNFVIESEEKITGYNLFVRLACADLQTYLGIYGLWLFEEKSGSVAVDSSGLGNNGVYTNTTFVKNKKGQAVRCFVDAAKVGIDDFADIDSGSFSYIVEVKRSSGGNPYNVIFKKLHAVGGLNGFSLNFNLANINLVFYNNGTNNCNLSSSVPYDVFKRIGFSFDKVNSVAKLYVNGKLVGTDTSAFAASYPINLGIGGAYGSVSQTLHGENNFSIAYNRVLSPEEFLAFEKSVIV